MTIGGTAATSVTVVSGTSITCTAPAHAALRETSSLWVRASMPSTVTSAWCTSMRFTAVQRWPEFAAAAIEDLRWLGLKWSEGPDVGGPHASYVQSQRLPWFREVWQRLHATGTIYPCDKSRKDVERSLTAPHAEDDAEPIFPPALRAPLGAGREAREPGPTNWRFRVPDGENIAFVDALQGPQAFVAGRDFGDFLVWRKDGFPAYKLAVVADDHAMGVTEVVRGADLLLSTARQLLLYRALGWTAPSWAHAPLIVDADLHPNIMRSISLVAPGAPIYPLGPEQTLRVGVLHSISPTGYVPFKLRAQSVETICHGLFGGQALRAAVAALKAGVPGAGFTVPWLCGDPANARRTGPAGSRTPGRAPPTRTR